MFYLDVDLYRYFIGREDQSVNEAIMIKRIDQQLKVTKLMIDAHDLSSIKNKKLQAYLTKYLAMMMIVSSALLVLSLIHIFRRTILKHLYKAVALFLLFGVSVFLFRKMIPEASRCV